MLGRLASRENYCDADEKRIYSGPVLCQYKASLETLKNSAKWKKG